MNDEHLIPGELYVLKNGSGYPNDYLKAIYKCHFYSWIQPKNDFLSVKVDYSVDKIFHNIPVNSKVFLVKYYGFIEIQAVPLGKVKLYKTCEMIYNDQNLMFSFKPEENLNNWLKLIGEK